MQDFARYRAGNGDWRAPGGYGAAIATAARALPVPPRARSSRGWSTGATRCGVSLADGGALTATQVICTLPTNLLAERRIAFDPPLDDLAQAAAAAPLGCAAKAFHAIEGEPEDLGPPESLLFGCDQHSRAPPATTSAPSAGPTWRATSAAPRPASSRAPAPTPCWTSPRNQIAERLGARWRTRLRPLAASGWSVDPWACGAYSHALPGHAAAREVLAAPRGRLALRGRGHVDRLLFHRPTVPGPRATAPPTRLWTALGLTAS